MEVLALWLILAVLVGVWASGRGHSGLGMFLVALIFSPLIGFLIEAIRGRNVQATEKESIASGAMKKCPACAELVRAEARKCRYCGESLGVDAAAATTHGDSSFAPLPPGGRRCSNCRSVVTGPGTHCGFCGEALGAV